MSSSDLQKSLLYACLPDNDYRKAAVCKTLHAFWTRCMQISLAGSKHRCCMMGVWPPLCIPACPTEHKQGCTCCTGPVLQRRSAGWLWHQGLSHRKLVWGGLESQTTLLDTCMLKVVGDAAVCSFAGDTAAGYGLQKRRPVTRLR